MTLLCRSHTHYPTLLPYWFWASQIKLFLHGHHLCFFLIGMMYIGITAGHGTLNDMQLKCRHDNIGVSPQVRNFWPYGGPWGSTEDFCSTRNSPELLRLHRIAPLPSALPNLGAPLTPQLQLGFTAAQALRRVAVRPMITTNANLRHSRFLNYLWHILASVCLTVQAEQTSHDAVSVTAHHHVLQT